MGKVKGYYLDDDYDVSVNPDFDDFDWDTPVKNQSWYTPSTEVDLDRDIPDFDGTWKALDKIWEKHTNG